MRVSGVPSAVDWRAVVYRHAGINNSVRVLLLYLADNMRADRTVSIPQSQIAADLGVNVRRVKERIAAARSAGLLDTVRKGRPGTTAMYQGLFPSVSLGTPGVPKEEPQHGADVRTNQTAQHGAVDRTIKPPLYGADGGPPISKRERTHAVGVSTTAGGSTSTLTRRAIEGPEEEEDPPLAPARSAGGETSAPARSGGGETAVGGHGVSSADRANRKALIDALQDYVRVDMAWRAGELSTDELTSFVCDDSVLWSLLDEVEDGLGSWASCYWTFPRACATSRYAAGKQLNMLTATYRSEAA